MPEDAPAPAILTRRQFEVIELAVTGHSQKQIGLKLGITQSTARTHMHYIYKRLGVSHRTQALLRLQELGYIKKPRKPKPPPKEPPLSEGLKMYLRAWERLLKARDHEVEQRAAEVNIVRDASCIDDERTLPDHETQQHQTRLGLDLTPLLRHVNLDAYRALRRQVKAADEAA